MFMYAVTKKAQLMFNGSVTLIPVCKLCREKKEQLIIKWQCLLYEQGMLYMYYYCILQVINREAQSVIQTKLFLGKLTNTCNYYCYCQLSFASIIQSSKYQKVINTQSCLMRKLDLRRIYFASFTFFKGA